MEFKEAIKIAVQSLWANKLRSILTLLGVVIGGGERDRGGDADQRRECVCGDEDQ